MFCKFKKDFNLFLRQLALFIANDKNAEYKLILSIQFQNPGYKYFTDI